MLSTKNFVLLVLEQNLGEYVSGERLARRCGVSRAAVWKAVRELRAKGFQIIAATNRGYRLVEDPCALHLPGILAYLRDTSHNGLLHLYPSLPSTSQTAKQLALEGAPAGTVVIAQEQTAGRGRMGRSFYSPKNCGIYLSILLRPDCRMQDAPRFTIAACVAVCRALEAVAGVTPQIKWVNDIFLNQKKICGIMSEGVAGLETGRLESMVVGVGVNVSPPAQGYPAELVPIAGALEENGGRVSRNRLCAAILEELYELESLCSSAELMGEYRSRSLLPGREVELCMKPQHPCGTVLDIDDDGCLLVRLHSGRLLRLRSGEVKLRGDFYAT